MPDNNINDRDYLFLSAMVKAREAHMLTREGMERMLSAPGFEEAAKMLVDCGYDDMSRLSAEEIETALQKRRAAIFAEIGARAPEKGTADAFRIKYDYHNAKVVIKSRMSGADGAHLLSDSGRVPAKVIADAYENDDYRFVPSMLANAMGEARGILARTGNPQLADFCLDRAYFGELKAMAAEMSGGFLDRYVKVLIDSANIRAAVRTLRMGRGPDFLKNALTEGGGVSADRVAECAVGEGLAALFEGTVFAEAARLGDEAAKGGRMTAFEMACDNAVIEFLRSAKLTSFGDAPIIAYLAAVENELTAVRMILTGRLAGIAPDTIRERLRVCYA